MIDDESDKEMKNKSKRRGFLDNGVASSNSMKLRHAIWVATPFVIGGMLVSAAGAGAAAAGTGGISLFLFSLSFLGMVIWSCFWPGDRGF